MCIPINIYPVVLAYHHSLLCLLFHHCPLFCGVWRKGFMMVGCLPTRKSNENLYFTLDLSHWKSRFKVCVSCSDDSLVAKFLQKFSWWFGLVNAVFSPTFPKSWYFNGPVHWNILSLSILGSQTDSLLLFMFPNPFFLWFPCVIFLG